LGLLIGIVGVSLTMMKRDLSVIFGLIFGTDLDLILAGYERRSRPAFRATHGALSDRRVDSCLAGSERHIRPHFWILGSMRLG
jgi:hypothetical protein